jgi:hypothetical protein
VAGVHRGLSYVHRWVEVEVPVAHVAHRDSSQALTPVSRPGLQGALRAHCLHSNANRERPKYRAQHLRPSTSRTLTGTADLREASPHLHREPPSPSRASGSSR